MTSIEHLIAELEAAKAAEYAALVVYNDASVHRQSAAESLINAQLAGSDIEPMKSICLADQWGFGNKKIRVVVKASGGKLVCHPVTAKGAVHNGHRRFSVPFDKISKEVLA